eukprot:TRINITY_DN30662_c0_g1_i1.p1 TRINITY_DN30662_c0_g1~~TRINITY_DN30662_c0_g1_i1.p1  ORF type:complete len:463 (-),score=79.34 TRINITY_DN30662_c0_g1_i1:47-1411(-)
MSVKDRRVVDFNRPLPINPPDVAPNHLLHHIARREDKERKPIPIPLTEAILNPVSYPPRFEQPNHYLRFKDHTELVVDYDLDPMDTQWLELFNEKSPAKLSADSLEALIFGFEMDQGTNQEAFVPLESMRGLSSFEALEVIPDQRKAAYNWWKVRRYGRVHRGFPLGKPLLPQLEGPPDATDIQAAFHRRDVDRATTRSAVRAQKTNTHAAYQELQTQRELLEKVRDMLQLVRRREKRKREFYVSHFRLWDAQRRSVVGEETPEDLCFAAHVQRRFGQQDRTAKELGGIQDLAQFLQKCREYNFAIPRHRIRLRPVPVPAGEAQHGGTQTDKADKKPAEPEWLMQPFLARGGQLWLTPLAPKRTTASNTASNAPIGEAAEQFLRESFMAGLPPAKRTQRTGEWPLARFLELGEGGAPDLCDPTTGGPTYGASSPFVDLTRWDEFHQPPEDPLAR